MKTSELLLHAPSLKNFSHAEKICFFAWHLHVHKEVKEFTAKQIQDCYDLNHLERPGNLHRDLNSMINRTPALLLKSANGYRLEASSRNRHDLKFGASQTTFRITSDLENLPAKIPNFSEQVFLKETISCLKAGASRAAITMAWNLAFFHILTFILEDQDRLKKFNLSFEKSYEKLFRKSSPIAKYEDFSDALKESETLVIAKNAGIISGDLYKLLAEKLGKRNSAAHPSTLIFTPLQAEAYIEDLIKNVVLKIS